MESPALSMEAAERADGPAPQILRASFVLKVFYAFGFLAVASLGISLVGKWAGSSIAMGGHSDDAALREIVIGKDALVVPGNMIRFEAARRGGRAERLDLYVRWPQMDGYSAAASDAFNHVGGARSILFLSFEPRMMSRDMTSRFEPIYRNLIEDEARPGPGGLKIHRFAENSGYVDEVLAVSDEAAAAPFVMRCLAGRAARESLAPCERDIHLGRDLSLTYRMPPELAGQWREVDEKVRALAEGFLRAGNGGG